MPPQLRPLDRLTSKIEMRHNLRTPPTQAIVSSRQFAARLRGGLALTGLILLLIEPGLTDAPLAAGIGFGIIALTAIFLGLVMADRWLRAEEALSCIAGFLIVTLGGGGVSVLTLIWLTCVAVGVLARGGRAGPVGRLLIVAILASPIVLHGFDPDTVGLLIVGVGLLLAVGRISLETSELLADSLTGVLSRAAFDAEADRWIAGAGGDRDPVSLVMVDLDDFGAINKRQGHHKGDELLIAAAAAMRESVRPEDAVGRVGGDEFAVLTASDEPEVIATRMLASIADTGAHASAGIARAPGDAHNAEGLLAAADVALRLSKQDGKDRFTHYEGPPFSTLSPGLAAENVAKLCRGEGVSMLVQPIRQAASGEAHTFEAVAQFAVWGRSQEPSYWLSLAAGLGRRRDLELTCLRAALALLPDVPRQALLSANLSSEMLEEEAVLEAIEAVPDRERLVLEIPEENIDHAEPATEAALERLRRMGVRFTIDGIGAGRANVGQLAVIRPAFAKLHPSVVRGSDRDPTRGSYFRSLAGLAASGGVAVIADGVESIGELEAIREAGIELVQGPLLGKPGELGETAGHAGRPSPVGLDRAHPL